jgi:hypothetical protein
MTQDRVQGQILLLTVCKSNVKLMLGKEAVMIEGKLTWRPMAGFGMTGVKRIQSK